MTRTLPSSRPPDEVPAWPRVKGEAAGCPGTVDRGGKSVPSGAVQYMLDALAGCPLGCVKHTSLTWGNETKSIVPDTPSQIFAYARRPDVDGLLSELPSLLSSFEVPSSLFDALLSVEPSSSACLW